MACGQKEIFMSSEVEQQWIQAYRDGNVEALGSLVEHTRRPLYGFIYRFVNTPHEADEVFQEAWFKAIRSLDRYEDKKFMSWMFRITHNLIIDRARKKKPDASLQEGRGENYTLEDQLEDQGLTPADEAAGRDLGSRIRGAVEELPEDQRAVFLMRTEGNLPFKEIAAIQNIPLNTALARMQYALNKLRDELATDYLAIQRSTS